MNWSLTVAVATLFLNTALAAGLVVVLWRSRPVPGTPAFALTMVAVAGWSFCYALILGLPGLSGKLLWLKMEYLGGLFVPAIWFVFALQFAGYDKWVTCRNLGLLSIIPLITVILTWTNEAHHLVWRNVALDVGGSFPRLDVTLGGWFALYAVYAYVLLLVATSRLIHAFSHARGVYRRQIAILLIATLIPWVGNVSYIFDLGPFPNNLDLTPYAFTLSGVLMVIGAFRFHLFDVVPVAREAVIASMQDAVFILDAHNRIVHLNPAAEHITDRSNADLIGQPATQVLSDLPELIASCQNAGEAHLETSMLRNGTTQYYDLRVSPLYDRHAELGGRLIVCRDITEHKQAEDRLSKLNEAFLSFGPDPMENINRLTALCGELLGASSALYNRLDEGLLCSWGQWQTPPGYNPVDQPEGHICYDVIRRARDDVMVVRNLQHSPYAQTDPNVQAYALRTYVGHAVRFGGSYVGSLCSVFQRDFVPTEEDKWLIGVIASAIAVEEKRRQVEREREALLVAERDQRLVAETLTEVTLALTSYIDYESILDEILRQSQRLVPHNSANIMLLDGDVLHTARSQGYDARGSEAFVADLAQPITEFPLTAMAIASGEPVVIPDTRCEPRWVTLEETSWIRSHLMLPIRLQNQTLGLLQLDSDAPGQFSMRDAERLLPLADAAAIALENARLLEETQRGIRELEMLQNVGATVISTLELDKTLQLIIDSAVRAVPHAEKGSLHLLDEERNELVMRAGHGFSRAMMRAAAFRVGEGYAGWAFARRQPAIVDNVQTDPRAKTIDQPEVRSDRSAICVPLVTKEQAIGTITLDNFSEYGAFDERDLRLLSAFGNQAALAIENAQLYDKTQQHAELMGRLVPLSESLNHPRTQPEVLEAIAQGTMTLSQTTRIAIYVRGPEDEVLCPWSQELSAAYLREVTSRAREMPGGGLLDHTESVLISDTERLPADSPLRELAHQEGYRSIGLWPLVYEGRVVAAVACYYGDAGRTWSHVEQEIMLAFCRQAAIALENAWLFEETRQRQEGLTALYQTSLEIAGASVGENDLHPLLRRIVERATALLAGDGGGLYLTDADGESVTCVVSYNTPSDYTGVVLQRGEGAAGKVLETGEPQIIADYREWRNRAAAFAEDKPFRAVISVPLKWAGQVKGVLHVLDYSGNGRFDEDDLQILQMFAHHAATAIEYSQRLEAERRWADELETLHQVALELTTQLELSKLLEVVVQRAADLLNARGGGVYLYDADLQELELVVSHNQGEDHTGTRLGLGEGLSGRVIQEGRPLTVADYRTWPGRAEEQYPDAPFTSVVAVPLRVGERILGVLSIHNDEREDRAFDSDDVRLASLFAAQAAVAMENARLYQGLEKSYLQTVSALANAVEARDTYTGHHSQQLADWAVATARALGLEGREIEALRWAAVLHDIGKLGVPDSILQKPGPLTDQEREIIELHPQIGAKIVEPVERLAKVAPIIRAHQERWDGAGYPDGLQEDEIPLESRILAVVDAYGAMVDDRVYRDSMSHTEAVAELKACAGTQFDPHVVQAFLQVVEEAEKT